MRQAKGNESPANANVGRAFIARRKVLMKRGKKYLLKRFPLWALRGAGIACEARGENGLKVTARGRVTVKVGAPRDALLCRIGAPAGEDVAQLALGEVESALCDTLFSPSTDTAHHFRGRNVCLSR